MEFLIGFACGTVAGVVLTLAVVFYFEAKEGGPRF